MNVDPDVLATLARDATLAADNAALDAIMEGATKAEVTRRSVTRAIEFLIGNGMVEVTDPATWPEWRQLDPPYGDQT